jgi:hypothetical protein
MTKRTKPQKTRPQKTSLPTTLLDDQVFETLAHEFDKYVDQIRTEDSHRHWQLWMRKLVRESKRPLRWLIELTHDKEAAIDADAALRDMAEEINQRGEKLPQLLTNYLICFPKPARGRGRREGDNFLRDQVIAVIVAIGLERWGTFYLLTRSGTSAESICSIVSRMCRSRGIRRMSEKRVKQIYDRFAEFLPVHQGWLAIKSNSTI